MKKLNKVYYFAAFATILISGLASCSKDSADPTPAVEFSLGEDLTLTYGQSKTIELPQTLLENTALTLSLDFSQTSNVSISSSINLHDQLAKAITFDDQKKNLIVNTGLLYPNGEVSTVNGQSIPEQYTITVVAKNVDGTAIGKDSFQVKVSSATISVKDAQNSGTVLFAYALYGDTGASFELDALDLPTQGTSWYLKPNTSQANIVSIENSTIKFSNSAGDPDKKTEFSYDLEPVLLKDGIAVASTKFKVNFIPQIKFLFGAYYPDLGFTIDLSLIHIGIGNGYLSANPTLFPEEYKSSFSLVSVNKDGQAYDNTSGIFSVNDQTGAVSVKNDDSLVAGSYVIRVKATTTTGLEFQTNLTLVMSGG
ncbi:hypothetical protein [Sphingobacterium sp. LRF_L2]|uniref:hypothetical protein n=1 Tax=Sphingobacterium sp. LRF_L2 TaxID=3369421 RepID=UPI003F5EEE50